MRRSLGRDRRSAWLRVRPWLLPVSALALWLLLQAGARLEPARGSTGLTGWAWVLAGLLLAATGYQAARHWRRRQAIERQLDLEAVGALPWDEFQHLVGEAYRGLGYHVRETGHDDRYGGADLVLRKQARTTLVECRRWRLRKVKPAMLREFKGVLAAAGADHGILVTTGSCTPEAQTYARQHGIGLVDGPGLLRLLQSVRRAAMPAPRPIGPRPGQRCPHCGREMLLRTVSAEAGGRQLRWRCTGFPACRGSRAVGAVIGRSRPQPLQRT